MLSTKRFWEKYNEGKLLLGTHITCNDPQQTEMIANVGFDYLWIDTEHTVIERYTLLLHLISARAAGVPAFVRIPWNDKVLAKPVLDIGADGLIFPMVNNKEEAERAIAACLYPPEGDRGFGPRRAIKFGLNSPDDYIHVHSKELIKLVQIETRDAFENIEEIASVPGVDILVLGPADLSGSFGKLNQMNDPEIQHIYRQVVKRAHAAGKPVLVSHGVYTADSIRMWVDFGVDMITVGSDAGYIMNGAKEAMSNFRKTAESYDRY